MSKQLYYNTVKLYINYSKSIMNMLPNYIQASIYSNRELTFIINKNYIRVSKHTGASYVQANDVTSALVYNQYLDANDGKGENNSGTSSTTFKDAQVYYIVVWLSENGHNQTQGATDASAELSNFFQGNVTFISAQGSEVTATFSGHTRVNPNT